MFTKILSVALFLAYVQAQGHYHEGHASSYANYNQGEGHGLGGGSLGLDAGHGGSSYVSHNLGSHGLSGGLSQGEGHGLGGGSLGLDAGHGSSSYVSNNLGSHGLSGGLSLGGSNGGSSGHHEEPHAYPKYQFKYGVEDKHTGDIKEQEESRDGDVVKGSYSLHQPDGTILTVHYTADKHSGYNAVVHREGHAVHPQHSSHH